MAPEQIRHVPVLVLRIVILGLEVLVLPRGLGSSIFCVFMLFLAEVVVKWLRGVGY